MKINLSTFEFESENHIIYSVSHETRGDIFEEFYDNISEANRNAESLYEVDRGDQIYVSAYNKSCAEYDEDKIIGFNDSCSCEYSLFSSESPYKHLEAFVNKYSEEIMLCFGDSQGDDTVYWSFIVECTDEFKIINICDITVYDDINDIDEDELKCDIIRAIEAEFPGIHAQALNYFTDEALSFVREKIKAYKEC